MQLNTLCSPILLAVALCAGTALAVGDYSWKTAATPQDPVEEPHEESALGGAMEHMNAALRKVRRGLKAGDGAVALAALSEFQTHVIAAKAEVPPSAANQPEAERPAFVNAFRATLVDVLRITCDLEVALIEGRIEDADTLFNDRLHPMEDAGHERFGGDD